MEHFLNEEQQVEYIKNWWNRFGNFVIAAVLSVVLVLAGSQYWQKRSARKAEEASILYEAVVSAMQKKDIDTILTQVDMLKKYYARTAYASYANFIMAKIAIDKKDYEEAEGYFKWVRSNSPSIVLKELANVRLVRLQIDRSKYQDALTTVDRNRFKVFFPIVEELKGDAEYALGDLERARKAYEQALAASTLERPILKMKLARLAKASKAKNKTVAV